MHPFVATMTQTVKRLTRNELDKLEKIALGVFESTYDGQARRIANAIQRAAPDTIAQFESAIGSQWREEPGLVEASVRGWYDDAVEIVGLETIDTYGMDLAWADVNDSLLETSASRAGWFSRAMTETSMEQTQDVITKWRESEGGTLQDLTDSLEGVWTGPRPQSAAITETTNIVAQSEAATYEASGWWGYNVYTLNDNRVRPRHTEVARGGPYPMSDTGHLPPIDGDVNCRCGITPVLEDPNG